MAPPYMLSYPPYTSTPTPYTPLPGTYNQHFTLHSNATSLHSVSHPSTSETSHPPASTPPPTTSASDPTMSAVHHPSSLLPPDAVVKKYPKLRGEHKMGKLAVALARESLFGKELMGVSSVGGRSQGVSPLPTEGLDIIRNIIFNLCPAYHHNEGIFESTIWSKCKTAINHACLKYRSC